MEPGPQILLRDAGISTWNAVFLLAVVAGYPILAIACRLRLGEPGPRGLALRYLGTAYGSALAAQLFAYLVDRHTSAFPAASVDPLRYYLDPFYGPKVLYGAVLALPLTGLTLWLPARGVTLRAALDCWTPPLLAVLGIARIGCWLEGCCYGVPASYLGMSFPMGSPAYQRHLAQGLIPPDAASLPVVPTQAIEALTLLVLCAMALHVLRAGRRGVFVPTIAAYSLLRFALEFARDDPERNGFGPLAVSQWIALAVVSTFVLARRPVRA